MAISDGHGLPLALHVASASPHETKLVEATLEQRFFADLPERLIGDRAYDSDRLDERPDTRAVHRIAHAYTAVHHLRRTVHRLTRQNVAIALCDAPGARGEITVRHARRESAIGERPGGLDEEKQEDGGSHGANI